jgi:hypothetical protein
MQTTALEYPVKYRAGMITRSSDIVTSTGISESSTDILQGQLVISDTAKNGVDLPVATFNPSQIFGIVGVEMNKAKNIGVNTITYENGDSMLIVQKGFIALSISDTVTKNQSLYFVHTAGGASPIHTFRSDADTARADVTPIKALEAGVSGDIIECYVDVYAPIGNI